MLYCKTLQKGLDELRFIAHVCVSMPWIVLRKLVLPEQLIHLELKISYHIKGTTPFRVECKVVSGQVLCQQVKFPHMIWVSHRGTHFSLGSSTRSTSPLLALESSGGRHKSLGTHHPFIISRWGSRLLSSTRPRTGSHSRWSLLLPSLSPHSSHSLNTLFKIYSTN